MHNCKDREEKEIKKKSSVSPFASSKFSIDTNSTED